MNIKKGDTVKVLSGRDRGKQGKVLRMFPKEGKAIVEKVNFIKKHLKPSRTNPQGGIQEKEIPLKVGIIQLLCPKCHKATRVGHGFLGDGEKVRICKKCREMIDA
jgi:large subunit ribosomal protein L24